MRLHNKIALITGAARGIGAATAMLFHKKGATVIISDIKDDEGTQLAHTLGEQATYLHLDVGSETDWQKAAAWIKAKFGRLDILVNNAGITGFRNRRTF